MQIILENGGAHFDPYLVRIFERHAEEIRAVALNKA
jgi:HD-GYP domain-containing protein (c-di-GMP phosphodiesterase class II)